MANTRTKKKATQAEPNPGDSTSTKKKSIEMLERDRLLNILNSMGDGICIINQQYDIEYINPALEAQFGSVYGRKCYQYFHGREEVCTWCKNDLVFSSGKSIRWELDWEKTGKTFELLDTPLINPDGSVSKLEVFRDITERKEMEKQLKQSEERYRDLYEDAPNAYFSVGADGCIERVNRRAVEFLGYSKDEMTGMPVFNLYADSPNGKVKAKRLFQRFLNGEDVLDEELEMCRSDGNRVWISLTVRPRYDQEGRVVASRSTVEDITERKRLESELRIKDYAVASTITGVTMADLQGIITYMNPACLSMWNYEKEEQILGEHASKLFLNRNEADTVLRAILEEGVWQGEIKAKRRDGSTFDAQISANLVADANGEPFCMMASFVDITERRRIEEALEHEEFIRSTIMENTGAQLAYLDRDFNFIMVNSAYAEGSGHTEEELINRNHFTLFPDKENQAIFERVRDTGEPEVYYDKSFEFQDQPQRGITYWDWTLTPVKDSSGRVQGLVLSLIDTTARKKVEDLKDSFIGMISHELRTPLTVINGCISTVLSEWDRLSSDEVRQLLMDAVLETDSLSHLIDNLLELSRFQAQQLALYSEETDIRTLVMETIHKIQRQASSHGFIAALPDKTISIRSDPLRVERILYNLLENAAKYSPQGSRIKISAVTEVERLVIGVHDEGDGLSPAEQARIFAPFERLEEAITDSTRGAGLGLMVCRVLVEAHGGEIWVESKKGEGATFSFSLPFKKDIDKGKRRTK